MSNFLFLPTERIVAVIYSQAGYGFGAVRFRSKKGGMKTVKMESKLKLAVKTLYTDRIYNAKE